MHYWVKIASIQAFCFVLIAATINCVLELLKGEWLGAILGFGSVLLAVVFTPIMALLAYPVYLLLAKRFPNLFLIKPDEKQFVDDQLNASQETPSK
jgi:hypothetical protein